MTTFDNILNTNLIIVKILKYLETSPIYYDENTHDNLISFKRINKKCYNIFNKFMHLLNIVLINPTDHVINVHKNGKLHIINPFYVHVISPTMNIKTVFTGHNMVVFKDVYTIKYLRLKYNYFLHDGIIEQHINLRYLDVSFLYNFIGTSLNKLSKLEVLHIQDCERFDINILCNLGIRELYYTGIIKINVLESIINSDKIEIIYITTTLYYTDDIMINNISNIGENIKYININEKKLYFPIKYNFKECYEEDSNRYYYTRNICLKN